MQISKTIHSLRLAAVALVLMLSLPLQTLAGGTLAARTYDIGNAKSLPWAGNEWRAVQTHYDRNRLVDDVLAFLTPQMPVIVRMETLRRALIYAEGTQAGGETKLPAQNLSMLMFEKLMARVEAAERKSQPDALAIFDVGFFVASWRYSFDNKGKLIPEVKGYELIKKASALSNTDATMEFAAALVSLYLYRGDQPAFQQHLQKAVAGAQEGSLLGRNMVRHIIGQGGTFEDLRAKVDLAKR